jgi:hypothetical protein
MMPASGAASTPVLGLGVPRFRRHNDRRHRRAALRERPPLVRGLVPLALNLQALELLERVIAVTPVLSVVPCHELEGLDVGQGCRVSVDRRLRVRQLLVDPSLLIEGASPESRTPSTTWARWGIDRLRVHMSLHTANGQPAGATLADDRGLTAGHRPRQESSGP